VDISNAFAVSGGEKFAGVLWSPSPSGAPVIDGVAASIDCSLEAEYDGGDHTIAVGRVHALRACADRLPLVYHRGGYGVAAERETRP
jgi:flavin reductase (DIM6/NTAB) family NADH-FMN oxidoreductase RutF